MPATRKTAIVQIGCGFRRMPRHEGDVSALSIVDRFRSKQACAEYKRLRYPDFAQLEFWTTGEVAWQPLSVAAEGTTLAGLNSRLMIDALEEASVSAPRHAFREIPGRTPFGECWNAVELARMIQIKKLVIVSSCFYFSLYRDMWEAAAKREGIHTIVVSVRHNTGVVSPEIWQQHQSPAMRTLAGIATSSRIGHWAVMRQAELFTRTRVTKGYQVTGHTSH